MIAVSSPGPARSAWYSKSARARRAVVAVLLAVPTGAAPADDALVAVAEHRRTSLLVRDLDRALRLYRDILGLRAGPARSQPGSGGIGCALRRTAAATITFVPLGDASGDTRLGLIVDRDMPKAAGVRVAVAVTVADLDSVLARLAAGGFAAAPVTLLHPGGAPPIRESNVLDADGNLILLQERPR